VIGPGGSTKARVHRLKTAAGQIVLDIQNHRKTVTDDFGLEDYREFEDRSRELGDAACDMLLSMHDEGII
jgi:hypothetical protein